jgi:transformation/transcription domain-associated protein
MMNPQTFQEIFSTTIDYMVDRIYRNFALQIVGNSFLSNPTTSPIFATVLVEYLLERMEEMGSNVERSNLYLKLFKLVFGSVSLFPAENEHMLRPHLHQIVNRCLHLAIPCLECDICTWQLFLSIFAYSLYIFSLFTRYLHVFLSVSLTLIQLQARML